MENLVSSITDEERGGFISELKRDASWLEFNQRVISQITREDFNVCDALKFIGIASHNLDEFISVRFAEMQDNPLLDNELREKYIGMIKDQRESIQDLYIKSFTKDDKPIYFGYQKQASKEYHKKIKEIFYENIFPVLTPTLLANNKEIPKLNEEDINFFIKLKKTENEPSAYCFLQIPHQLNRLYKVGDEFILIEHIVQQFLGEIFNTREISSFLLFRVLKKYNKEITHDNNEPLVNRVHDVLVKRDDNDIMYLEIKELCKKSKKLATNIRKILKVPKEYILNLKYAEDINYDIGLHYVNENVIKEIFKVDPLRIDSKYPEELVGQSSIMDYLDDDDLFIHQPYETFDVTIQFLKEAVMNPKTISIKQTLYRVSSAKSPIVKLLCDAAARGIQVTVMLELLARFDERNNISLINILKNSGVNIVYSLENYKTHCKMLLVTKKSKNGIKLYSHISTGNYNEKTSKIYTDFSYFTSRTKIGMDLNSIFNMITGFSKPTKLNLVSCAPYNLFDRIKSELEHISQKATPENPCQVLIKVNSINDPQMIELIKTYAEANPNLQFKIICRGICTLDPSVNITIKSVVGLLLEHSRMFAFVQKGRKSKVFISSADLLTRNLFKRIEILVPVLDKDIKNRLIKIFTMYWEDQFDSWYMTEDKSNRWNQAERTENGFSAQAELLK